jgi:glycosyltransferase involved in cell wall biosynthesis
MAQVVLPVLDEAAAIPLVLDRMPPGFDPIVVDNGSSDGSAEIAARCGARVIAEPRRGFGAACFAGLLAARGDVVCFMDCDGSLDPRDLTAVTAELERADLVLGSRRPSAGAWPWPARLANRVLVTELARRGGPRLSDLGPMRAARREALLELGLRDRRFGWPLEMVVRAQRAGWTVAEVDVPYSPRAGGRSKVTGTVRGTVRTIRDMAAVLA